MSLISQSQPTQPSQPSRPKKEKSKPVIHSVPDTSSLPLPFPIYIEPTPSLDSTSQIPSQILSIPLSNTTSVAWKSRDTKLTRQVSLSSESVDDDDENEELQIKENHKNQRSKIIEKRGAKRRSPAIIGRVLHDGDEEEEEEIMDLTESVSDSQEISAVSSEV